MGRPGFIRRDEGLTRSEIAKQLGVSYTLVRRWHEEGKLAYRRDRDGYFRSSPEDVAELARKLRRSRALDGKTIARIYAHFEAPGFEFNSKSVARIVIDTEQPPDEVLALWRRYNNPDPEAALEAERRAEREAGSIARLHHEYDEQIAAMEERFGKRRSRAAFIPGEEQPSAARTSHPGLTKTQRRAEFFEDDDAPPSSRRTGT